MDTNCGIQPEVNFVSCSRLQETLFNKKINGFEPLFEEIYLISGKYLAEAKRVIHSRYNHRYSSIKNLNPFFEETEDNISTTEFTDRSIKELPTPEEIKRILENQNQLKIARIKYQTISIYNYKEKTFITTELNDDWPIYENELGREKIFLQCGVKRKDPSISHTQIISLDTFLKNPLLGFPCGMFKHKNPNDKNEYKLSSIDKKLLRLNPL